VGGQFAGRRLDLLLAELRPDRSRASLARAVAAGCATLDGRPAKPSTPVKAGQILAFSLPGPPNPNLEPAPEIVLKVLHQDEQILVVDKPARLTVHPGAGLTGPTLAAALLALEPGLADVGPPSRPGLVHRLDKDTSGALIVARTPQALEFLSRAFAERQVDKTYLAFVGGQPPDEGLIELAVGRHPTKRSRMAAGLPGGRPAKTFFKVLRRFFRTNVALASLDLHTGRTHQARVHMAAVGTPVLADPVYGTSTRALVRAHPSLAGLLGRQFLHARRLAAPHPAGGRMSFQAPWPEDFIKLLKELLRLEKSGQASRA
jgi:23S rRNA pseudouridine1911/1915/1917 synthase